MKCSDDERFARIERDTSMGYAATFKDLAWLVRLVGKLTRGGAMQPKNAVTQNAISKKKTTVNFFFVDVADPAMPSRRKYGAECEACGEKFFDRLSKGAHPRVLESGISAAIEHAKMVHQSNGGTLGGKPSVKASKPGRVKTSSPTTLSSSYAD